MAFEDIIISVAGLDLRPVTIGITLAADQAARSFEAKIKHGVLSQKQLLRVLSGAPACTIKASGTLIFTGFLEKRSPRLASVEKEIPVAGRSKTADAIDSSATHVTGEFKGRKAPDVFDILAAPHGVRVISDLQHQQFEIFRLRPGETVFRAFERWSRKEGFSISDTERGDFRLLQKPDKRHAGAITDGVHWPPLVDASAVLDESRRSGTVKVKAQAPDGYSREELEIEQEATDSGARSNRLRVIVPPEQLSKTEARNRAKWHRDRAAGAGVTAEVTIKGWRDEAGTLWEPGRLVFVEIDDLDLSQEMMVETVNLKQADAEGGGTQTTLSLVDPRAYGGKAGKGTKSGKQWDLGKAGADDE